MCETISSAGNGSLVFPLGRQITFFEEPRKLIASLILITDLACTTLLCARPRFQCRTPLLVCKAALGGVPSPSMAPLVASPFAGCMSAVCLLFMSIDFTSHASVLPLGYGEIVPSPAFHGVGAAKGEGGEKLLGREHGAGDDLKAVPGEQQEEKV